MKHGTAMKWIVAAAIVASAATAWCAEGHQRIGVGAHYWRALNHLSDGDFDRDGLSWMLTYQYRPGWLGAEADVEWFKSGFGGSANDVYEPQAYVIVGKTLYAAAGIGGYYTDGDFAKDPFYVLRAGLDLELLPILYLDVNASYRFDKWSDLKGSDTGISTETVTLGAAARLAF